MNKKKKKKNNEWKICIPHFNAWYGNTHTNYYYSSIVVTLGLSLKHVMHCVMPMMREKGAAFKFHTNVPS